LWARAVLTAGAELGRLIASHHFSGSNRKLSLFPRKIKVQLSIGWYCSLCRAIVSQQRGAHSETLDAEQSMSADQPSPLTVPYVAVACAATLVGGLLLPKAAFHGLDRGLLVWLAICVASGVVLSNLQPLSIWRGLKASMLASVVLILALVGFYSVRWLVSRIINIEAARILIPFGSGASVDVLDPRRFRFLIVLLVLFWIGTSVATAVATLSGRLLIAGALKLYAFGPDGVERVRKTVVALVGVVLSIVALWAAFG
jgi:hypothetical protein